MIEFSRKHAASDEKTWRVTIINFTATNEYFGEEVQVIASEDINIGGVLDFVDRWAENRMEEPNSNIVEYKIISIEQIKICACCQREIPLTDTYCDEHKAVVKHIIGEWDNLVDSK